MTMGYTCLHPVYIESPSQYARVDMAMYRSTLPVIISACILITLHCHYPSTQGERVEG